MRYRLLALLIPLAYFAMAATWIPSPGARLLLRDPSYYYLLSSMKLSRGERSEYYAHPGAPLQALGSIGILITSPPGISPSDLLKDHARYLRILCLMLIALNAFLLALAGWLATRRSSIADTLFAQLFFFVTPLQFGFSGLFQPESLLISAGSLFWICYLLRAGSWLKTPLILGTLIATKMYFASYLAAALQSRSTLRAARAIALSLFVAVAWCLAILAQPSQAWNYLSQLLFRTGAYSYTSGNIGRPGFDLAGVLYRDFWEQDRTMAYALGALFLLSFLSLVLLKKRWRAKWKLLTALAASALAFALYMRQPTHNYYALPAATAAPAAFWLLLRVQRRSWLSAVSKVLLIAGLALVAVSVRPDTRPNIRLNEMADAAETKLVGRLQKQECGVLIHGPVPYPVDAISMGAGWSAPKWQEFLAVQYPNTFFAQPTGNIRPLSESSSMGNEGEKFLSSLRLPCLYWLSGTDKESFKEYTWASRFKLLERGDFYYLYFLDLRRKEPLRSEKVKNGARLPR